MVNSEGVILIVPLAATLAGDILLYEYDAAAISDILGHLTLDAVRVTLQAKSLSKRGVEKDTSDESPIAFPPIDADEISERSSSMRPATAPPKQPSGRSGDGLALARSQSLSSPHDVFLPRAQHDRLSARCVWRLSAAADLCAASVP